MPRSAQPEACIANAATDDDRYYAPLSPTAGGRPLIWLDENGEPDGTFDVFDYIKLCRDPYEKAGLGADYVNSLFR
ncbi:MAG TPA: hypothetical protein VF060_08660 [Trebonia sp.]